MVSDFAQKLKNGEQAATPLEKEEGSQASTTSAEPSLSAHETSGATLSPIARSQPLCVATPSLHYCEFRR